jgi:NADPH2:quinone reductase
VRHSYIAVNFIDVYFRTGRYPLPLPNGIGSGRGRRRRGGRATASSTSRPGDRVGYLLGRRARTPTCG